MEQGSKRQKKIQEAKDRNMTRGQLWRAREKKQKNDVSTLRGQKGILIITSRGRERLGTNEAISSLGLDENFEEEDSEEEEEDLQTALEKEISQVKTQQVKRYEFGMECLTLVTTTSDPLILVETLFNKVLSEQKPRTTHVEKLIPFQIICHPSIEIITEFCKGLITLKNENFSTFAIVAKVRSSTTPNLNKSLIIKHVADLIDHTKHPVNLLEPDIVILIEVIRSITGISLVSGEEYRKFKRFHLRSLLSTEENEE